MTGTYSFGGLMTTGYDGGLHEIHGEVFRCGSCGALVFRDDQGVHDGHHARLDALAAPASTETPGVVVSFTGTDWTPEQIEEFRAEFGRRAAAGEFGHGGRLKPPDDPFAAKAAQRGC